MGLSDDIRAFVHRYYVYPAADAGVRDFSVRAGDVHLANRMPAVYGALESRLFVQTCGLERTGREGPHRGANAVFHFRFTGRTSEPPGRVPETAMNEAPRSLFRDRSLDRSGAVYLVSCVSRKRGRPTPAKDLYISELFRKARRFVEARQGRWFILSAEHGLVDPDQVIAPYDKTLNAMGAAERREWVERVTAHMEARMPDAGHVVFLASARYREHLVRHLEGRGVIVEVPMKGLRIGEQLSWLTRNVSA